MTRTEALNTNAAAAAVFNVLTQDTTDVEALVDAAYANFLGLEGEFSNAADRKAFWVEQLQSDALSTDDFASEFLFLAENEPGQLTQAEQTYNQTTVPTTVEAADTFVAQLAADDRSVAELSVDEIVQASLFSHDVVSEIDQSVVEDTDSTPTPPSTSSDGVAIELVTGNPVVTLDKSSSAAADGATAVTLSAAEEEQFAAAQAQLFESSSSNFGTVLTFTTGDDTLEVGTIEFVGQSDLSTLASQVGYDDWIDFALFNGELVTPESVGVSEQEFFFGDNDLEYYFGYDWPLVEEGPTVITRPDGQDFTAEVVLYDALGVANTDVFVDALA